jgi:hypothetical protein
MNARCGLSEARPLRSESLPKIKSDLSIRHLGRWESICVGPELSGQTGAQSRHHLNTTNPFHGIKSQLDGGLSRRAFSFRGGRSAPHRRRVSAALSLELSRYRPAITSADKLFPSPAQRSSAGWLDCACLTTDRYFFRPLKRTAPGYPVSGDRTVRIKPLWIGCLQQWVNLQAPFRDILTSPGLAGCRKKRTVIRKWHPRGASHHLIKRMNQIMLICP